MIPHLFRAPRARRITAAGLALAGVTALGATGVASAATATPKPIVKPAPTRAPVRPAPITAARSITLNPTGAADLRLPAKAPETLPITLSAKGTHTWSVTLTQTTGKGARARTTTVSTTSRRLSLPAGSYGAACTLTAARPAPRHRSTFLVSCTLTRGTRVVATLPATGAARTTFSLKGSAEQQLTWRTSFA